MSDSTTGDDKKRGTLSLKPRAPGTVRQNFSHGRTNSVVVETKKRRIVKPGGGEEKAVFAPKTESVAPPPPQPAPETRAASAAAAPKPKIDVDRGNLSRGEMDARARALEEAKIREAEDAKKEAEEAERRKNEDAAAREAREKREADEAAAAARKVIDDEAKAKKEAEDARMAAADASAAAASADPDAITKSGAAPNALRAVERPKEAPKPSRPKAEDDRRRTKLTLSNALTADSARSRSLASMRRQRDKQKRGQKSSGPREKVMREVTIPDTITIQELANRMSERAVDVVKLLMAQGQMMKPGDLIDADMAQLITEEMGHTVLRVSEADVDVATSEEPDNDADMVVRPPVVTIMGHVDHGKTSLLDKIREARVAAGEAGGITQHIAAYQIERDGKKISFLDTPGHAAFTAMRSRGAESTDIAILVVAADDSVMPQTIESISHAKAAGVPMIVAINKMDTPGADAQKVRTELLQHEVFVEGMGGEILDVEVSAKTGDGIDNLLDAINLQAELMELKANPDREGEAVVIEARLDKSRGAVATAIVQRGTLNIGDIIVAGAEWGRVRAMLNDNGTQLKEAGPSTPIEILGLSGAPSAGDTIVTVESEARAREISDYRARKAREMLVAAQAGQRGSLEQMMSVLQEKGASLAPLVIKADTQGSVEAIVSSLNGLGTDEVQAQVVHSGAGGITEADVTLAMASETPIIAFNVRANKQALDLAKREGIEIRYYSVIYNLIDDVRDTLSGMLAPERRETFIGYADILELFTHSKVGKVAGCLVTEGHVERGMGVRLLRDDVVIHEGELATLKRFKDEVARVDSGTECGMAFKKYEDMRKGDRIECFTVEMIDRSLEA
ncbi:translation initiation factor IF-2 [Ahrensia sp. R2A130]|uniref:translation initiation factor IF-2 n=1 Tax=Ahrensia sp. R2A130 TaxID=744979 RepID=UPI0001E0BC61|nr:translation initiation factor IF-2 [Ahrensia sp. R2A130]EFL89757.1 translation initiation factor IF-2 [Ahrensia sp. R2A130]